MCLNQHLQSRTRVILNYMVYPCLLSTIVDKSLGRTNLHLRTRQTKSREYNFTPHTSHKMLKTRTSK